MHRRGFTLVEVAVALGVLALGILCFVALLGGPAEILKRQSERSRVYAVRDAFEYFIGEQGVRAGGVYTAEDAGIVKVQAGIMDDEVHEYPRYKIQTSRGSFPAGWGALPLTVDIYNEREQLVHRYFTTEVL